MTDVVLCKQPQYIVLHTSPVDRADCDHELTLRKSFFFPLQLVIPGDVTEMTEFQEKTMNSSRFVVELCLPNVQVVLPSKAFYEKLHNR